MNRLYQKFEKEIKPQLKKELKLSNINQIPRVEKIIVSVGIGRIKEDKELIKKVSTDIEKITGQRPIINVSNKSISSFKLRIGQPVGLSVTLRDRRMYDFIERFTRVGLPRIRDFKGLSEKSFDNHGNFSIGVNEHVIMPEIKFDDIEQTFGFQVNIKTTAEDSGKAKSLLESLGFPFEKVDSRGIPSPSNHDLIHNITQPDVVVSSSKADE